jgi:hypothetical protein
MCAANILMKNPISLHYAHTVFFGEVVCNISLALLKNGHLFLSIFGERCHFFSRFYRKVFKFGDKSSHTVGQYVSVSEN